MPQIRIDDEVWSWLKGLAVPLEDTPNTVLRRLAGLEGGPGRGNETLGDDRDSNRGGQVRARRSNSGRKLNVEWGVGADHALYHKAGTYYEHLRSFPGALFDENGYVLFRTEAEYLQAPGLQHGQQLNVPRGISSMPGYVRKRMV